MWHRANLWLAFVAATTVGALGIGWLLDLGTTNTGVIAIGLAGIASAASTRYFVLARTGDTIALMTGSPIRRVAKTLVRADLTPDHISPSGNTLLATDWKIAGRVYTVPKSCDQDMQAMLV